MTDAQLRHAIDSSIDQVHRYFKAHGEDPTVIAPDFFLFWISQGYSPAQMLAVACNRREEPGYGHAV